MIPIASSRSSTTSNVDSESRSRSRNKNRDERAAESSNSGVRPRNRRLDSTIQEQELVTTSTSNRPAGSRAISPIPARHPSRSLGRGVGSNETPAASRSGILALPQSSISLSGLGWDGNWASSRLNAFQEVAFSMLGGASAGKVGEGGSVGRMSTKKEGWFGRGKTPAVWGPDTGLPKKSDQGLGAGSTEIRDAEVKARRRARMLEGRDEGTHAMDSNGNHKRRISTEQQRPGSNHEADDALVYVHHVQSHDTIQGVVLKYHCQMDVFKKANRFWDGDSIQTRKVVYLPVDACAIKGRPCEPPSSSYPNGIDLLAPTPGLEESPFPYGSTWNSSTHGKSAELPSDDENLYTHVRWVLLDASPSSKPVEIVRMLRKSLNYFPPRRRKSLATFSAVSTPRASSDLAPAPKLQADDRCSSTTSTPSRRTSNLGPRPNQITAPGSYFPPPSFAMAYNRPRLENSEVVDRKDWLQGPGGVGTLGKSVRKPGPGKDVLNSWTKRHIPGLAIDSLPSSSLLGAESARLGFDNSDMSRIAEGAEGPSHGAGGQGIGFPNLNLAPAAVEHWLRKIATTAALPGTPRGGARPSEPVLIEMLDGAGSDDGRGFELDPGSVRSSTPIGGTGRENVDGLVRGRGKSGKND